MKNLMRTSILGTATICLLFAGMFLTSNIPFAHAKSFTDQQKEELGNIIYDYIMSNPGIVMEAYQAHQKQQEQERQSQAQAKIGRYMAELTSGKMPSIGNTDGDVTVIEFFDYNCGYCKKALPDVQALLEKDQDVNIVFVEMPILGDTSKTAALWALAAHRQDKYFEYHTALMELKGQKTEETLEKLAQDVGLNVAQMKKDIESPSLNAELDRHIEIARDIGVTGTPAFVVGDQFFPGYLGEERLLNTVKQIREGQKG